MAHDPSKPHYDPALQQLCLGPKLVVETGNQLPNMAGKTSFCLESTNDAKQNFILAHTECGRSKMMTDGCLVVESGEKSECPDPDITFIGHKNGFSFSSDAGSFKVSAETITLEADVEIVIQAPSIRIGFSDENGTKDLTLNARNVDANAKGGNIGDTLGTSNFMSIFAGGALGGLAAAAAGIAGAAGGAAGQAGLGANGQGNSGGFAASGGASIGDNLSVKTLSVENSFSVGSAITITSSGNVTSSGIVTATKFVGNGADLTGIVTIPTGVIVMWSGAVSAIPSGWVLCDGNNSTPDLRSRFIVGATGDGSNNVTFNADTGAVSSNYSVGVTGGSVAHQLTVAEMPSHSHTYQKANSPGGGQDAAGSGSGDAVRHETQNTSSQGSNDFHENRPPYYALAFIMKT